VPIMLSPELFSMGTITECLINFILLNI
jgi:hypothetical protein